MVQSKVESHLGIHFNRTNMDNTLVELALKYRERGKEEKGAEERKGQGEERTKGRESKTEFHLSQVYSLPVSSSKATGHAVSVPVNIFRNGISE